MTGEGWEAAVAPSLLRRIERARAHRATPEEREADRIDFAYGNLKMEYPRVTREMVERIARVTCPPPGPSSPPS